MKRGYRCIKKSRSGGGSRHYTWANIYALPRSQSGLRDRIRSKAAYCAGYGSSFVALNELMTIPGETWYERIKKT